MVIPLIHGQIAGVQVGLGASLQIAFCIGPHIKSCFGLRIDMHLKLQANINKGAGPDNQLNKPDSSTDPDTHQWSRKAGCQCYWTDHVATVSPNKRYQLTLIAQYHNNSILGVKVNDLDTRRSIKVIGCILTTRGQQQRRVANAANNVTTEQDSIHRQLQRMEKPTLGLMAKKTAWPQEPTIHTIRNPRTSIS